MSLRAERIRLRLLETLTPQECLVTDESALHVGHPGAAAGGGHFRIRLVAAQFEGQKRVARHRLVYHCLDDMMHSEIHALALIALAPSEAAEAE
ncbi:MAG: BolA family transcriptional regulator [Gallionellales bacterium RBG_16_56_9]|nr:MAG: BolA family transcriptional regulator [Gallionellales bacterium RBG_16_56_9]